MLLVHDDSALRYRLGVVQSVIRRDSRIELVSGEKKPKALKVFRKTKAARRFEVSRSIPVSLALACRNYAEHEKPGQVARV